MNRKFFPGIAAMTLIFVAITYNANAVTESLPNHQNDQDKTVTTKQTADNVAYNNPEVMPTFNGKNIPEFAKWIYAQLKYPIEAQRENITGRVTAQFYIEPDGTLDAISILLSPHQSLSNEVYRILESSPKWEPGTNAGKPVRVRLIMPINFSLKK